MVLQHCTPRSIVRVITFGLVVVTITLSLSTEAVAQATLNREVETSADSGKKTQSPTTDDANLDALLDLADKVPERLQSIQVKPSTPSSATGPETVFTPQADQGTRSASTGALLSHAPGVVIRSTSAFNQDVRIRGYSGSQLVGVADGMNQMKTRLDIDSLFSQIDPTLIESFSVIPGPYILRGVWAGVFVLQRQSDLARANQ